MAVAQAILTDGTNINNLCLNNNEDHLTFGEEPCAVVSKEGTVDGVAI